MNELTRVSQEVNAAVTTSAKKYLDYVIHQKWHGNFDVALACRDGKPCYEALLTVAGTSENIEELNHYARELSFTYDDWRPDVKGCLDCD